jgi:diguanylate cyclase (GGDEF)-like protein
MTVERSTVPILVVEDDRKTRLALSATLAPLGYKVVEAASGIEALRCLMVEDFAVIVLDVVTPEKDGFQTAALIRGRRQSQTTPIIFISAYGEDDVERAERYSQGAVDFIFAPVGPDELRAKVSVFATLFIQAEELAIKARDLQTAADQLELLNLELTAIARRDALTGLRNRLALTEDLEIQQARTRRYGHSCCLALLDIDLFLPYNETYGQQAGDRVLQAVADRLTETLRGGDLLYRYGGEEFLCIFPEQSLESGGIAAERMRRAVEDLSLPHDGVPSGVVTVSAGLAILEANGSRSSGEVIKDADDALYRAKGLGRNRVERVGNPGPQPVGA